MARSLRGLGDSVACARRLHEAREILEDLVQKNPRDARYLRNLGAVYTDLGTIHGAEDVFHLNEPKLAIEYLRKSEAVVRDLATIDKRNALAAEDLAINESKLAAVYVQLDPTEALRYANSCLGYTRNAIEKNPKNIRAARVETNCLQLLSFAYLALGQPLQSIPASEGALRHALAFVERDSEDLGGQENVILAETLLGRARIKLRQFDLAEKHLHSALARVQPLREKLPKDLFFIKDNANIHEALGNLHAARAREEDLLEARDQYDKALALWDLWLKLAHPNPYQKLNSERVKASLARFTEQDRERSTKSTKGSAKGT
jgi:tetratricopeptide (TPR) repeat protein